MCKPHKGEIQMTIGKKLVLAAVLMVVRGFWAATQTAEHSYYVSANGNDKNDGRSEDAPFKTFAKAVDAALKGTVKTVTSSWNVKRKI
jgi:hypothetical protein